MHRLNYHLTVSLLAAFIITGCKPKTGMVMTSTMIVDLVTVEDCISDNSSYYPGQTEAESNTDLSFKVMGVIDKVLVKEGDFVRKGDVLARLDSRDYLTQLKATESEYRQIKSECERVFAMYEEKAVSDNDYEKAVSGLEQITAKLKNHQDQVEDCELRSPYNAYIGSLYRSVGELTAPGVAVMRIFNKGGVDVVINIPESEYLKIAKGDVYKAKFTALPDKTFNLNLKNAAVRANSNQLFQLRFNIMERTNMIVPGMSVMVGITHEQETSEKLSMIPTGALLNDGEKSCVFVYDSISETVSRHEVKVERLLPDGNAIVSGGLGSGVRIVGSGVRKLQDGLHVKPINGVSKENVGNLL